MPDGWDDGGPPRFDPGDAPIATRKASEKAIQWAAARVPHLIGGSADLASSTNTDIAGGGDVEKGAYGGRNLRFGVREHGMGAIVNGLGLHGFRAFGATFFTFSDYMRGAVRLSALMKLPVIWVWTHDSIGLGEDGPTHQPIEQLAGLRAMPRLNMIRPADANETALAWQFALRSTEAPTAFALSRQNLPILDPDVVPRDAIERGAYVLRDADGGEPELILIGTGSEVSLCVQAADLLEGVRVRVVSMPCMDTFSVTDQEYRDRVLPPACRARIAVEAASPMGWDRWIGTEGRFVGMETFGESGPAKDVYEHFGITAERVSEIGRELMFTMSTAAQVNERLARLTSAGVSVWLDQIRRSLVEGGELARMVEEESLRGVTSNPSIFEKAILGSDDYKEDLAAFAREGLEPAEIYDRLSMRDVQLACDVLAPLHEELGGNDGFVSLEVTPDIAHDTERTLAMVRDLWKRADRPNLMIKIPGTPEGVPAVEQALYEGINVNITLLFAVEAYEKVAEAFLRAMERRHQEGLPLGIHSVASFFVSRVDTNADKKLEALGRTDLAGTAAVANARAAYRRFKELFSGERWETLRGAGAVVQRPLWASTGTKNPAYSDVKYVEELVGPDTVNTMPMATLHAVADHLDVTGTTADTDPTPALDALAEAGVDMKQVTDELLVDGVEQFEKAMDTLLAGIDAAARAGHHRSAADRRCQAPPRGSGPGCGARQAGDEREGRPARLAP